MPASEKLSINGIVAAVDSQPYIQLSNEHGIIAQLTMAQARQIAYDLFVTCSRIEADAMIIQFFEQSQFPQGAAGRLLSGFRELRRELDSETVDREPENNLPQR